jgi:hypothetical protein
MQPKSEAKLAGALSCLRKTPASQKLGNDMLRSPRVFLPLIAAALLAGLAVFLPTSELTPNFGDERGQAAAI